MEGIYTGSKQYTDQNFFFAIKSSSLNISTSMAFEKQDNFFTQKLISSLIWPAEKLSEEH
jgi:hypothetical protein